MGWHQDTVTVNGAECVAMVRTRAGDPVRVELRQPVEAGATLTIGRNAYRLRRVINRGDRDEVWVGDLAPTSRRKSRSRDDDGASDGE